MPVINCYQSFDLSQLTLIITHQAKKKDTVFWTHCELKVSLNQTALLVNSKSLYVSWCKTMAAVLGCRLIKAIAPIRQKGLANHYSFCITRLYKRLRLCSFNCNCPQEQEDIAQFSSLMRHHRVNMLILRFGRRKVHIMLKWLQGSVRRGLPRKLKSGRASVRPARLISSKPH